MKTKIFFGVALFNLLFYLAMESIGPAFKACLVFGVQYLFGLIV